jgi:hypothetical protein
MKKTVLNLCIIALFCSCIENSEALFESAPVEVIFSAGATRATDATWTAGDAVGIYMLPTGVTTLGTAKKYTADAAGKLTPDGTANTLYYPIDGTGVRFVASYPYNTTSFAFADQSTKAKKEAVDFCFHRGTEEHSKTNPAATLNFEHKFSKILMTVKKGDGGPSSVKNVVVKLSGIPASATVDLEKLAAGEAGAITTSGTTIITPYTVSSSESTTVVEAIIAPHSGTTGRTLTFTAGGKDWTCMLPGTFAFEAGKVYALDATLNGEKTVVSDKQTNCYIVATNTELTFPVTRAYESGTTLRTGGTYAAGFGAEVVWEDAAVTGTATVTGSGNTAKVTVKTNWGFPGNAVVKIYKAADAEKTAVWSYHIWVTDYDPAINTWTNNGFTFMDRNLGATEAGLTEAARGLFYQWGRKDPFPTGTVTTVATSAATGTIAYTIKNPTTFITATSSSPQYYDWHYAARDNTLWGHGTTKSVYDPCPAGWRVPVNSTMTLYQSPWYRFTKSDVGTWNSGYIWYNASYSAAGNRSMYNGELQNVGYGGYCWSASPVSDSSSSTACCLYFNSSYCYANYTYNRPSGNSVRCVRE